MILRLLIMEQHYDFYYFAINRTLGPNNRLLFDYSAEPPISVTPAADAAPLDLDTYNPLSRPSKNRAKDSAEKTPVEGTSDDPTYTKVVDRRWYERNKHIFPASVWQEFDPEKDYQKEVKRDAGGNAFFFS
jgi:protein FAM50